MEHPLKPGQRFILPPPPVGDCAVCAERRQKEFEEEQVRRENRRTAELFLKWSQVGDHYRSATFESFENRPGTEAAVKAVKEYLADYDQPNGNWLLLFGPPGNGKTHLAMALRNEIERTYGSLAVAITQPYLLQQIRASWNRRDNTDPDSRSEEWILAKLQIARFVLIDDLAGFPDWAEDRFFTFIDGRYRTGKRTVFTSNLGPDQLEDALGPRLWSRFAARTEMVRVVATDYRVEVERPRTLGRKGGGQPGR
ncbi:MAG: ATP-binding protein [Chitinophagales bacterium]